jgi:hypothetical protein
MKDYKKYLNPANKVPMIEVLLGNDLVNMINQTKKKISIKHYLNTYLFPVGENYKGEPLYPLYYRVIFNKQSVKIKSSIDKAFSVREFENGEFNDTTGIFRGDNFYWNLMEREALSLTYIISDFFMKGIHAAKTAIHPKFQNEHFNHFDENIIRENSKYQDEAMESVVQGFDINLLFKNFEFSKFELPAIVEEKLFDAIDSFSFKNDIGFDVDTFYLHRSKLNAYQYIQFLKEGNKKWEELEKQFPKPIWFFNLYYYHFVSHSKEYKNLGATTVDLLYLNFEKDFSGYAGNELSKALTSIKNLVEASQLFLAE